jgi:hypothetical protein
MNSMVTVQREEFVRMVFAKQDHSKLPIWTRIVIPNFRQDTLSLNGVLRYTVCLLYGFSRGLPGDQIINPSTLPVHFVLFYAHMPSYIQKNVSFTVTHFRGDGISRHLQHEPNRPPAPSQGILVLSIDNTRCWHDSTGPKGRRTTKTAASRGVMEACLYDIHAKEWCKDANAGFTSMNCNAGVFKP